MDPERWQRAKQILDEVIALEPQARSPFLERACADDADIRKEVESLLASHDEAGTGFLKSPAVDLKAAAQATSEWTGRRIGVYQIVEEIGHGGMGEVYRAVRADGQYSKEVAIKFVRGGFDSKFVLERFRNERQILATLDHPNIARLFDGSTTDDGIPYLVMELIEGERIDQYCDEQKLSITQRLQLFRQVCAAVQYAHQRLVIHRDIKPSNVLVTKEGIPKLLDFGIAKIFDPTAADGGETTIGRPMTPEYASPEQIRGQPITTASDVYSLGVVLYQLLTGRSPYPGETRSTLDLARAVCDTDPSKPSTAVLKPYSPQAGDPVTPEQVSGLRLVSTAKLRSQLAGDLDDIVLMSLRKEPQGRYASVEHFSEDIRRHMEGLPVTASRGSWRYRARKFVSRHRIAVAASAAVAIALIAGIAATVREARIARHQAELAQAERTNAEKRFNDVRKLANSLIFEIHDSIQDLPGATPSRKLLLDRAVEYLDKLSQDSGGDIDLQRELASGYQRLSAVQGDTSQSNLGQITAAEASIRKSIALFEAVAKENPHNVQDQLNLASAYRRRAFTDIYERSGRQEIDQALAITDPLMKTDGAKPEVRNERSVELQILGAIQDAIGDRLLAIDTDRQYLELRRDIRRTNPEYKGIQRSVAHAMVEMGFQMGRFGDRVEARRLLDQGIADFEQLASTTHNTDMIRDLAASQVRRGMIKLLDGEIAPAIADLRRARETTAKLTRRDPENKMLQSDMCGFDWEDGRVLVFTGKAADGSRKLQAALKCFRDLHLEADTGPGVGLMESWIAEAQTRLHNLPEALKHYRSAETALKVDLGKYDDARCDLAMVEVKIAGTLAKLGKAREAADEYQKAIETADLPFSTQHSDVPSIYAAAEAYAGLGNLITNQARAEKNPTVQSKRSTEALQDYQQSLSLWKKIPYPARITGSGYLVGTSNEVADRLAMLRTPPGSLAQR